MSPTPAANCSRQPAEGITRTHDFDCGPDHFKGPVTRRPPVLASARQLRHTKMNGRVTYPSHSSLCVAYSSQHEAIYGQLARRLMYTNEKSMRLHRRVHEARWEQKREELNINQAIPKTIRTHGVGVKLSHAGRSGYGRRHAPTNTSHVLGVDVSFPSKVRSQNKLPDLPRVPLYPLDTFSTACCDWHAICTALGSTDGMTTVTTNRGSNESHWTLFRHASLL